MASVRGDAGAGWTARRRAPSETVSAPVFGWMWQRVSIALALSCKPGLLILDEPTTALDVTIQAQILDLLEHLRDELKVSMLFITHDLGVIVRICDSVCVLYAGSIVEQAATRDLFE